MTLPVSGPISFENLRDEFGDATGSVSFLRYYKGTEGEVPRPQGYDDTVNVNVPISGTITDISLNDFYGGTNFYVCTIASCGLQTNATDRARGYSTKAPFTIGQIGTGGDFLYNLSARATQIIQRTENLNTDDEDRTLVIRVSAAVGTTASLDVWTSVTFRETNVIGFPVNYSRTDFDYVATSLVGGGIEGVWTYVSTTYDPFKGGEMQNGDPQNVYFSNNSNTFNP